MVWLTRGLAAELARCAAVFEPGDPARTGRVAFRRPDGSPPPKAPVGERGWARLVVRDGTAAPVLRSVPVLRLTVGEAIPVLALARREATTGPSAAGPTATPAPSATAGTGTPARTPARTSGGGGPDRGTPPGGHPAGGPDGEAADAPHPAAAFWGGVLALGLQLLARERALPGVSPGGYDTWRAGPFDAEDVERLRELVRAVPPEAVAGPDADVTALVRGFLDAVADTLPRTPAARTATGRAAFAAVEPQYVPQLRAWADEISSGVDSGVRVSLRIEIVEQPGPGDASRNAPATRLVPRAHSLADPTVAMDADALFAGADHALGPAAQTDMVRALRRAADVWPPLERLLPVPRALDLTPRELRELLGPVGDRLAAHGVEVVRPAGAQAGALTARAVAGPVPGGAGDAGPFFGRPGTAGAGEESKDGEGQEAQEARQARQAGPVHLSWQLCLDDDPLTEEEAAEVTAVVEAGGSAVRLRGRWVLIGDAPARTVRDRGGLRPLTAVEALAAALTGGTEVHGAEVPVLPDDRLVEITRRLTAPGRGDDTDLLDPPAALDATLRDYQLRGLTWLHRLTSLGLGGCLADDMGLGKTVQLIALHLLRRERGEATGGPTLVVCPASLLGNWEREVKRFAPGVPVRRHHGPGRTLEGVEDGFVLTTYGTMRLDAPRLAEVGWDLVVADEAQHVKNAYSSTAKALRRIGQDAVRIALTGTPVENNLSELWAILDWTTPGLLGGHARFRRRWIARIDAERAGTAPPAGAGAGELPAAEQLAALVSPFLLRRRKSDPGIAPELPPKTETDRPVPLTAEQAALYRAQVDRAMARIRAAGEPERGEGAFARAGMVLRLLTSLKQICNHPAQFLKEDPDAARLAGRSGKLELLDELLGTIIAEDGAALVFTQYVTMARLLERHLTTRGIPALLLHGGTPVAERERLVRRFQDGEAPVFLLSLKAAGTGLNLTRAEHVVHYDRWWNPAVEAQATDRAHRIGQTRPVQVHRMIVEGTVEDRIAALLEAKKELADAVLGSGEQVLARLSDDELADLVALRSTA
ncbi:SNF2-related protein [Streptomyces sp. NPDC005012]|uniref:SNF2-related protein n=1 Tax=Streptomyces sp. NPDC005012 TaxID=3154558 RepID=UPI0033B8E699